MARYCALVAGATGVVGRALVRHLAADPEWEVIGVSRSGGDGAGHRSIAADIASAEDCRQRLGTLSGVTHLLYCARASHTMAKREPVEENMSMLRNVLDTLEAASPGLAHVHIVQGSKVYGSDLGPYRTPAKESDPRVPEYNWYYAQEDLLVDRCRGTRWTWSASRPHGVCEGHQAVARSLANMIGVYAAIMKALDQPLCFPGTQAGFDSLYQSVDADLLARAIAWIVTAPACANRSFNVNNGDYLRWRNLWPALADFFTMEIGPVNSIRLADWMVDKGALWDAIVAHHGLSRGCLAQSAVWSYADFNFARPYDIMSSTIALRQTGFAECLDTERMYLDHLRRFRAQRAIP